jgi:hypothetical protein
MMKLSSSWLGTTPSCRSGPNPRIRNKQVESNTNSKNTRDKVFIPWFSSPPRLAYVHVVEETT